MPKLILSQQNSDDTFAVRKGVEPKCGPLNNCETAAPGSNSISAVFEKEVVSFFVDAADVLGVPKSVAAIYGVCFANIQPLSFADIAKRLAISQGSISQGLRVLKQIGALRVVGCYQRREYFAPDFEVRKMTKHFFEERLEKQLRMSRSRLRAIRAALPHDQTSTCKGLKTRLRFLQSWHNRGRALVPLVKTFLNL